VLEQFHAQLEQYGTDIENREFAASFLGVCYYGLGFFFAGYCVFKILFSMLNIILQRKSTRDPITFLLTIIMPTWFKVQVDFDKWSQWISFFFIGVIIATSIRSLLITIHKAFSFVTKNVPQSLVVLLFAHIIGTYSLSLVLLSRMNLPAKYRSTITDVLGDIEFDFYHLLSDWIFMVSALLSLCYFYLSRRMEELNL
jgi:hypothetical protein